MSDTRRYTTQLQAGLGLVNETKALLELWEPGMTSVQLYQLALSSGSFPSVTARRLRNIVAECFAPRYLVSGGAPAAHLKRLAASLPTSELTQLMLIFTSRANPIVGDFIRDLYWTRYAGGYEYMTYDDARVFVERALDDGRMAKRWSETTVRRVSAYLVGCCADYGLLERATKSERRVTPLRIAPAVAAYLAHDLHFAGFGDSALLTQEDWQLFGLSRDDVLQELKGLSLMGHLIVQAAGEVVRISWKHRSLEALCDALTEG